MTHVVTLAFHTENLCKYRLLQIAMCDLRKVQVGLFSNDEKIDDKKRLVES